MKKNILSIATAATVLFSASSVFAAEEAVKDEAKTAATEQSQEEAKQAEEVKAEEAKK
jgi:hypothetical protein